MTVSTAQRPGTDARAAALAPLCEAMRSRARATASRRLAAAEQAGQQLLAQARAAAAAAVEAARARGAADAEARLRSAGARSRLVARRMVLAAQRETFAQLRELLVEDARSMLSDPEVRTRLAAAAGAQLGPDATVHEAEGGGVVAQTADGRRRIDASAEALVDRALAHLDLEWLWASQR